MVNTIMEEGKGKVVAIVEKTIQMEVNLVDEIIDIFEQGTNEEVEEIIRTVMKGVLFLSDSDEWEFAEEMLQKIKNEVKEIEKLEDEAKEIDRNEE